jgi:trimeric autotransporter adhesin
MKKCMLRYVFILIFLPQLFSLQAQNIQAKEFFQERGLQLPGHSFQQENNSQVSEAQLNSFISADDGYFSDQFIRVGLDGVVEDVTVFGGDIIIGGRFQYYNGGENLNNIARWNGEYFEPVGASFFSSVDALLVQNSSLIAAGRLINQEGRATTVARWDGSSWQSLGDAFDDGILGLADYGGEIVAAGGFLNNGDKSVNNIAKWNGSGWEALDSGVQFDSGPSVICALEVHDDYLIAGGEFSQAGSNSANSIARWDGTDWQPLGEGFSRSESNFNLVSSLTTFEGNLILSGFYSDPLSYVGRHTDIMMWAGTEWTQLGDRFDGKLVQSMAEYKNKLVTAGSNLGGDQNFGQYLSFYENSTWTEKQNILQELESVRDINSIFADGERLIMGGSFHNFESGIYNVAFFQDGLLSPQSDPSLNFAPLGAVHSMINFEGDIILGGDFKYAGSGIVNNIVRFTGPQWEEMGDGFEEAINVIIKFNGDLIAAGNYSQSNQNINIARWNGTEWEPLGSGLTGNIRALIEFEGKLIAAGTNFFSSSNNNFAVWDGEEWSLLIEDPGDFFWSP